MSRAGPLPIMEIQQILLVSMQTELSDEVAGAFQQDLLTVIEKRGSRGLVIDISGLEIVDTYVARVLADTAKMAELMGTETVICGMRPEVALTLVQMGYPLTGIRTALNVDDGLARLQHED